MNEPVSIDTRALSPDSAPFLIAEAGVNHNGDLDTALRLIDIAAEAGADAVKFQTFRAQDLVSTTAPVVEYQKRGAPAATQRELLAKLQLADDDFVTLRDACVDRGVLFLSTPHTEEAVDLLRPLVPAFKIGSADLTHQLLLEKVAATGLPVLLATGMGTLAEVQRAVGWLERSGASQIVVMHCTTAYPCALEDVNLAALETLRQSMPHPIGYSDHTPGIEVSLMAATMGACVIEKHFTHDRGAAGPDHAASLEPAALADLVRALAQVPVVRGTGAKQPTAVELPTRALVRKSLVARSTIAAGTTIERAHLRATRPLDGIGAEELDRIVGSRATREIPADTTLSWSDVDAREPSS